MIIRLREKIVLQTEISISTLNFDDLLSRARKASRFHQLDGRRNDDMVGQVTATQCLNCNLTQFRARSGALEGREE
jgi:hypothetical protein